MSLRLRPPTGRHIDMKHFSMAAKYGQFGVWLGIMKEFSQLIQPWKWTTAFKAHDFYSNYHGSRFGAIYNQQLKEEPLKAVELLYDYIKNLNWNESKKK